MSRGHSDGERAAWFLSRDHYEDPRFEEVEEQDELERFLAAVHRRQGQFPPRDLKLYELALQFPDASKAELARMLGLAGEAGRKWVVRALARIERLTTRETRRCLGCGFPLPPGMRSDADHHDGRCRCRGLARRHGPAHG